MGPYSFVCLARRDILVLLFVLLVSGDWDSELAASIPNGHQIDPNLI